MSRTLPDSLEGWLHHIEGLHHRPVDLGLERVRAVAARMASSLDCVRIVVGGTNGKGSTCAMLDAIYRAAGYRTGRYASPHLVDFLERVQVDGQPASAAALAEDFAAVERARGDTSLTYFEFSTLAVLSLFARSALDVAILEVGLGGRLDAVNLVDADCSIVTTIDLDHTELLGDTREQIGWEKAHIFRPGRPAICVDPDPPASLLAYAGQIGARLRRLGEDFESQLDTSASRPRQWNYRSRAPGGSRLALSWPALRGEHQLRNAAGALAAIESLAARLPVDQRAVREGLARVQLPGRFQVLAGRPTIILDVAHNPHAARALGQSLRELAGANEPGRTLAVFGMLRDKDASAVVGELAGVIDRWYLAASAGARGQSAAELRRQAFAAIDPAQLDSGLEGGDSVGGALARARSSAAPDDRIVIFGSFVIVAESLRCLERGSR